MYVPAFLRNWTIYGKKGKGGLDPEYHISLVPDPGLMKKGWSQIAQSWYDILGNMVLNFAGSSVHVAHEREKKNQVFYENDFKIEADVDVNNCLQQFEYLIQSTLARRILSYHCITSFIFNDLMLGTKIKSRRGWVGTHLGKIRRPLYSRGLKLCTTIFVSL